MPVLLEINTTANIGSTGRIAEEIAQTAMTKGYDCYFGYGRVSKGSKSKLIRIGTDFDNKLHGIESLLLDNHGFASRIATKKFVEEIERIKPDVINLHNIHGYYLNVEILFNYLSKMDIPIVWTLHDCWPFTGHCSYFDRYQCEKWKTGCYNCPNSKGYPKSIFLDRSKINYERKKDLFTSVKNITFVAVCDWMARNVQASFLGGYPVEIIYNGVDVNIFKPRNVTDSFKQKFGININSKVILGVASTWDQRKGLNDFIKLRSMFNEDYTIILVGLRDKQIETLPSGIIGVKRTNSVEQLAELYSLADVFVNPTYVDNFPTTNIEALSCGTPVITYCTGGSPEAIDGQVGIVVDKGDIKSLFSAVKHFANSKSVVSQACRERAYKLFNKNDRFEDYVRIFNRLIKR